MSIFTRDKSINCECASKHTYKLNQKHAALKKRREGREIARQREREREGVKVSTEEVNIYSHKWSKLLVFSLLLHLLSVSLMRAQIKEDAPCASEEEKSTSLHFQFLIIYSVCASWITQHSTVYPCHVHLCIHFIPVCRKKGEKFHPQLLYKMLGSFFFCCLRRRIKKKRRKRMLRLLLLLLLLAFELASECIFNKPSSLEWPG